MAIVDSPYNGVTLCTGSLGADPENDMVKIVHALKGRINFVHFRNVLFMGERKFKESAHLSTEGSLDMYAIMKALVEVGFDGVIRPDHGRTIWGKWRCQAMVYMIARLGSVIFKGFMKPS